AEQQFGRVEQANSASSPLMMWCAALASGVSTARCSAGAHHLIWGVSPDPFGCRLLSGPCKGPSPSINGLDALRCARDRTDHGTNSTDAILGRAPGLSHPVICPNLSRRSEWVNQIYLYLDLDLKTWTRTGPCRGWLSKSPLPWPC